MNSTASSSKGFSGLQVFMMIFAVIVLSVVITSWVIFSDIFASKFEPVTLNSQEEQVLIEKLNKLGIKVEQKKPHNTEVLEPEAYSETDAKREIVLSEKEINAMLAKNTDLADKLAIDLSDDLMSAKLLLPLDKEMPVLGGKTLKLTAGVVLAYKNDKPVVIIKGVSIWGVPVPSAYLGDLKNLDLVQEFGGTGFWRSFANGLNGLQVEDGSLRIKVKE